MHTLLVNSSEDNLWRSVLSYYKLPGMKLRPPFMKEVTLPIEPSQCLKILHLNMTFRQHMEDEVKGIRNSRVYSAM